MRTLLVLIVALLSTPAVAQRIPCADRANVVAHLSGKYHETPIARGVDNGGRVLELVAAPDGATWTLIVTIPGGPTCLLSAGESWQEIPRAAKGPAS